MIRNLAYILSAAVFAFAMASGPVAAETDDPHQHTHRPMQPYLNADGTFRRLQGSITTSTWSGYAVTVGAPYTSASATWTVPNIAYDGGNTPAGYEYVFNWVGIGGYGDSTLIQIGTEEVVSTSGATYFYTWYGVWPGYSEAIGLRANPGDVITASLQCIAACFPGQTQTWQLSLANETANSAWTQSVQYQSSMASAEWITEAPSYNGSVLPLGNYSKVSYGPVAANATNPNLSLSANGIIAQVPWGETSNPSAPVNGDSFSTCWGAKGASLTPCTAGAVTVPSPSPAPPPPPPAPANVAVTLTATPTATVTPGQASKLTWVAKNATSCSGSGFNVAPAGWALVFPRVTTSYAITCAGPGGPVTSMVTVTVKSK